MTVPPRNTQCFIYGCSDKKINTYSGYDELWADGRLYIKYYGAAEHEVLFDGRHWQPAEAVSEARGCISALPPSSLTLLINASSLNTLSAGSMSSCLTIATGFSLLSFFACSWMTRGLA